MCPLKIKGDDFFARKYQSDLYQVDQKTYEGWSRIILVLFENVPCHVSLVVFSCVPIIVSKQYLGTSFLSREDPQKHLYNITCTKVYIDIISSMNL